MPNEDLLAERHEDRQHVLQIHGLGTAGVERHTVDAEARLQRRELVKLVQHDVGHGVATAQKARSMISSVCGAAEALTRSLAVELAPLRVNLVCPGLVKTDSWDGMAANAREAMFQRAEQNLLVGRAGAAEDLAEAYVYLMRNGFSTGQIVVADGGVSVG